METEKEHINPKFKKHILRALEYHFPEAEKIYLFGSRARKTHEEGADVDIAIDLGGRIDFREMARARRTMQNIPVPLKIDLVDMHAISSEFKETILEEGVLWKS